MSEAFTTLRVIEAGVILHDGQLARLAAAGPWAAEAFARFARAAAPGVFALRAADGALAVEARPGSRLSDGIPVRLAVSPVLGAGGPIPKPAPPGPYGAVRSPGVSTLLTDAGGRELFEACSAALVGWDGATLVLPPPDRPRVASLAEAAIRGAFAHRGAPLRVDGPEPLLLVNAVRVAAPAVPGRPPFPPAVAHAIEAALLATARRC